MDRLFEEKAIKSAWESPTFGMNVEIVVLDGRNDAADVGSATISPSGRDVAIASYVISSLPCLCWCLTYTVK